MHCSPASYPYVVQHSIYAGAQGRGGHARRSVLQQTGLRLQPLRVSALGLPYWGGYELGVSCGCSFLPLDPSIHGFVKFNVEVSS